MIQIEPIHAFSDNFIWLLRREQSNRAVVVDPGDAAPVLDTLKQEGLDLAAILITHKHGDHVGGIERLLVAFPNAAVFGPADEPIPGRQHALSDGDRIQVPGIDADMQVFEVRGHTEGHIAYYCADNDPGVLFCGDTLFSVGCGRVFSGTFDQLHDSLMKIAALPDSTLAYCAHEYTLENIGFAKWVEPDNQALLDYEAQCHAKLAADENTVPSSLATEKSVNPFIRIHEASVKQAVERHYGETYNDGRSLFRALRTWKDTEYD
ncbi:MAG: hydroxyacylglutathione hydrolase [Gammaproteobacteria bacterium]